MWSKSELSSDWGFLIKFKLLALRLRIINLSIIKVGMIYGWRETYLDSFSWTRHRCLERLSACRNPGLLFHRTWCSSCCSPRSACALSVALVSPLPSGKAASISNHLARTSNNHNQYTQLQKLPPKPYHPHRNGSQQTQHSQWDRHGLNRGGCGSDGLAHPRKLAVGSVTYHLYLLDSVMNSNFNYYNW